MKTQVLATLLKQVGSEVNSAETDLRRLRREIDAAKVLRKETAATISGVKAQMRKAFGKDYSKLVLAREALIEQLGMMEDARLSYPLQLKSLFIFIKDKREQVLVLDALWEQSKREDLDVVDQA